MAARFPARLASAANATFSQSRQFSASSSARAPDLSGIKTIGVVGSGQMGVGIAYVSAAIAKREVLLLDANPAQVEKGLAFIGTF